MHEETEKHCLYEYNSKHPPCVTLNVNKFSNLENFIAGETKEGTKDLQIALKINCIQFNKKKNHIDIKNENCINCMFCVFGCPGNNIEIRNDFTLKAMCSNFTLDYDNKLGASILDELFHGKFIKLPKLNLSHFEVKYNSFQDFTSTDETENIAVWGANILKYLSKADNPKIGLEINVSILGKPRPGRLDICLLNDSLLFAAETKISLDEILKENRYVAQLKAYEEVFKTLTENTDISYYQFLLIGGEESDLLPESHEDCSSKVGRQSQIFYKTIINHNFFFISSNALLSLSLLKLFKGDLYSLENIYKEIFKKDVIGLLSAGLVYSDGSIIPLIP